jgi:hypothetical protein
MLLETQARSHGREASRQTGTKTTVVNNDCC